jgi:hypothetical protein
MKINKSVELEGNDLNAIYSYCGFLYREKDADYQFLIQEIEKCVARIANEAFKEGVKSCSNQ